MELVNGWIKLTGMCPGCMHDVKMIATAHENGWELRERCECRQIDRLIPWPFKDGGALEVTANDFSKLGFDIEIDPQYEDLMDSQDDDYLNEVDYGWDWSHTG